MEWYWNQEWVFSNLTCLKISLFYLVTNADKEADINILTSKLLRKGVKSPKIKKMNKQIVIKPYNYGSWTLNRPQTVKIKSPHKHHYYARNNSMSLANYHKKRRTKIRSSKFAIFFPHLYSDINQSQKSLKQR